MEKKFGAQELDNMITRLDPKEKGFITYADAVDALEVDHEVHRPTMANEGQVTAAPKHKGNAPYISELLPHAVHSASVLGRAQAIATRKPHDESANLFSVDTSQAETSIAVKAQMHAVEEKGDGRWDHVVGGEASSSAGVESLQRLEDKLRNNTFGSVPRLVAALKKVDTDMDGHVSYNDFRRTAGTKLGIKLTDKDMRALAKHFDAGGTGQIDYRQVGKVLKTTEPRSDAKERIAEERRARSALRRLREALDGRSWRLKDAFAKFDANGDGKISASEFRQGIKKLGLPLGGLEVDRLARWVDSGLGGKLDAGKGSGVSYSDFVELVSKPMLAYDSHLEVGQGVSCRVLEL